MIMFWSLYSSNLVVKELMHCKPSSITKANKCTNVYSRTGINIVAWNVQGLGDEVLNDSLFNNMLDTNDIIILTETWLEEQVNIRPAEFYSFNMVRPIRARAPRPSGGISVLMRHELREDVKHNKGIKLIQEDDYFVWMKMCRVFFKMSRDIYICSAYIPPEGSTFYIGRDTDPLAVLERDIMNFSKDGDIMLLGDLNARTAELTDHIPQGLDNLNSLRQKSPNSTLLEVLGRMNRNNLDTTSNSYGKAVVELCKNTDMRILNGRTIGDLEGAYTSFQYNGKSVVDYCIVSESLLPAFNQFKVLQPNHLSDHAPISTKFAFSCTFSRTRAVNTQSHEQNQRVLSFKWDENSSTKFRSALRHSSVQAKLSAINEKVYEYDQVNACCDDIINSITAAAKFSLKVKTRKTCKTQQSQDKLGFDGQCRNLKNRVLHLGNLVKKYPKDPIIYGTFRKKKKEFKRMVAIKNKEAKNKLLDKLAQCQDKDPNTYWKMIKRLRDSKTKQNPISLDEWAGYFKNLHNVSLVKEIDTDFTEKIESALAEKISTQSISEVLDKEFTMDEVLKGIKALKNRKSAGPDAITNEMLKAGSSALYSSILKLFNLILISERFPTQWATGFLIPIFKSGWDLDKANYRGISVTSCVGKLFSLIINSRLVNLLEVKKIISPAQIGFRKGKRTSDHVFALKCILEEAKSRKQPIFCCFVDLKKAFDTVWREGLFYKLLFYYNISPKYVRIFKSMYYQLKGMVRLGEYVSQTFDISIGIRQGCNLSPNLFNMYINDLPKILDKANCDPVSLNATKISMLLYADDMVLLSNSDTGLQRALHILEVYCKKWQLVVNTKKTKVMIFNTRASHMLQYGDELLETVQEYKYLGIIFHKSGTFTTAIKDLSNRAAKAYYRLRSIFKGERMSPRLMIKLFDTMVKPIILYCSEVWGGFGLKKNKAHQLLTFLFDRDSTPFEKLNLKLCKQAIGVNRNTSNIGSRAELGRIPIIKSVIVATLKYYARLSTIETDSILYHAYRSQDALQQNSNGTITFMKAANLILEQLDVEQLPSSVASNANKDIINKFGKAVKEKCINIYTGIVSNHLEKAKIDPDTKMGLYAQVKKDYKYEAYLDSTHGYKSELAKFRLSNHWLPIERGRYAKPKIIRTQRVCILCRKAIGNELHAMFRCTNTALATAREQCLGTILNICPQLQSLTDVDKMLYLLKGNDTDILQHLFRWLAKCNAVYKNAYKTKK